MTYRELLNELSTMPAAALDQTVAVDDVTADEIIPVEKLSDLNGVGDDDAGQVTLIIRQAQGN